ncbi:hypothetical protein [Nesterenkonia sandarakina]|uniref:Uncharacterized protein n=1 Tax=Nesterenkonia sandarakina TaxID=272918 RepID=A0A2T0YIZ7_9MICC|nr:hypothetical protein [Nesterenkonia sandarakina]PRZ15167.1 hypothetical protein BCL67_10988 [Nesterenkonia sandarakina]
MTTKHQLDTLLPPAEQQAMVNRALAADAVRRAAIHQWDDPCGTRDRELSVMIKLARHRGLDDADICTIIHDTREEAAHEDQEHQT